MANEERLRVSFSRKAHANLVAHAKESVDEEVCGVLVGEVHDKEVDVRAVIRGAAARAGRAHVTFTHETWNHIHATLDKEYPDFQIVGWYHTHPGFGVEFSAMDRFIHENFFSGPTQVAYLSDPLSGETSLCTNSPAGIEYLTKFWVDGREHTSKSPAAAASENVAHGQGADVQRDLERLEQRVNQLIQALDEQRSYFHRTLLTMLVVVCFGIITAVGWQIWSSRMERLEPPRVQSFVPVPVKVGDKTVMLGVGLVQWDVPRELDALLDKIARAEVAERKRMQEELQKKQQERQSKEKRK
jgi:proteasome lid subunit RPN8/RPN11